MKLENIIAVSGLPGLHNLLASRNNGLLIESLDNKKRQFVSARKHQFTPLVSIGIYTYMDTISLDEVLKRVHQSAEASELPDVNEKAETLRAWFKTIVSDHDEDKVHINDIRKVIKWYLFLKQYAWDMVNEEDEPVKTDDSAPVSTSDERQKTEEDDVDKTEDERQKTED